MHDGDMIIVRGNGDINLFLNPGFYFRGLSQTEEFFMQMKFDRRFVRNIRAGKCFRSMPEAVPGIASRLSLHKFVLLSHKPKEENARSQI